MIVTLTTDFGLRDGYVAAMKGRILAVAPEVRLVDVTHQIPAQDVMAAGFVLRQAAPHFPEGTVHLAVVDPGVGTSRRGIAAEIRLGEARHVFVGPDNGLLPLLLGDAEPEAIAVLDRPEAWATDAPSATFHGRDIFGPVAAALAAGARLEDVGTEAADLTTLHWPLPRRDEEGIDGMVIHIDRFGNCVTNIRQADVEAFADGRAFKCYVGSAVIQRHVETYGLTAPGDPLTLFGSTGFFEVAVNGGNAAELLTVERGASVNLLFDSSSTPAPSLPEPSLVEGTA
ncbi:MAG: SAM-dependent chlorinase/fluorinase [Bacteroidota bacterium]